MSILLHSMGKYAREKVRSTLLFREERSKIERKRIVRAARKESERNRQKRRQEEIIDYTNSCIPIKKRKTKIKGFDSNVIFERERDILIKKKEIIMA